MRKGLLALLVLGILPVATTLSCETCIYGYHGDYGRVYNCFTEAKTGRLCPPDHSCYSMKIAYTKTGMDLELGNRDPPTGDYTWIWQGCVYNYSLKEDPAERERLINSRLCGRTLRRYSKMVMTEDHTCEHETCDDEDKCNRVLTDNLLFDAGLI